MNFFPPSPLLHSSLRSKERPIAIVLSPSQPPFYCSDSPSLPLSITSTFHHRPFQLHGRFPSLPLSPPHSLSVAVPLHSNHSPSPPLPALLSTLLFSAQISSNLFFALILFSTIFFFLICLMFYSCFLFG